MKKHFTLLLIAVIFCNVGSYAQFTRYIVKLKNKGTNPYSLSNPSQYLSVRALQRRARYNIAIDSADLPITPRYIDSIRMAGAVTILNTSKWLNQVAIQTTDAAALAKINGFSFVISAAPIASIVQPNDQPVNKKMDTIVTTTGDPNPPQIISDYYSYGQSYGQVHLHNGEFLHNRGFRGQGMQMTVLDAGFYHYLSLPTFDSMRNNNQVLGTWDFVAGNASVDEDHTHGMNCLSTIAANMPGVFMGTAPKASFYLYRTEDVASEYPIEEQNWAAGAERSDSLGVDVCSVSLGYFTFDNSIFNYTYADMNGDNTISARAADIAAKKGMLIVLAAGNEGNGAWHYIITPSDADSVIAVGAVNTSGVIGSFSSYGPSSDGQIKPCVAAVGVNAVIANPSTGQPSFGSGTSFACPNMAGLTTCLWQAFPEVNNMGIISSLQAAANRATNPDNRTGYGIPDMKKAFVLLVKQLYTQQVSFANCKTTLQCTAKTDSVISIIIERKLPTDINYSTLTTLTSTGGFVANNFSYTDDLTNLANGLIKYRFKMIVAADTSFFLDSATVNYNTNCTALPVTITGQPSATQACVNNNASFSITATGTITSYQWQVSTNGGGSWTNINGATNTTLLLNGVTAAMTNNQYRCVVTGVLPPVVISNAVLLTVNPLPAAAIAASPYTKLYPGLQTTLTATPAGSYTWYKNNIVVPGATSNTLTVKFDALGDYKVMITDIKGCTNTSASFTISDSATNQIFVYPNPSSGLFTVSYYTVAGNSSPRTIGIFDAKGARTYSQTFIAAAGYDKLSVDIRNQAKGLYLLILSDNNGKKIGTIKIEKQ
jgi:hypothetical protein